MSDELDLASVPWRPAGVRHLAAAGLGEPADGRGAHVGGLPVPGVGGAAEDPHRDDDHHLQEDLRQPRHPVEVGAKLNIPLHSSNPFSEQLALAQLALVMQH